MPQRVVVPPPADQGVVWRRPVARMPAPGLEQLPAMQPIPGCPQGLEYLSVVDQLLVHQQLQLLEMLLPFEQQNKYVVKNSMGQFVFMAFEESDMASRCCCSNCRPFEMALFDYRSVEVMRLYRPLRCISCLCFCCLQVMEVHAPPGTIIGSIRQDISLLPRFSVLDSAGNAVLQISGPCCTSAICCGDVVFDILARDGRTKIGMMSKNWSGVFREAFTDIDNFTVTFPIDLDVKIKATLLAALFLIDFIFFESGSSGPGAPDLPGNLIN